MYFTERLLRKEICRYCMKPASRFGNELLAWLRISYNNEYQNGPVCELSNIWLKMRNSSA